MSLTHCWNQYSPFYTCTATPNISGYYQISESVDSPLPPAPSTQAPPLHKPNGVFPVRENVSGMDTLPLGVTHVKGQLWTMSGPGSRGIDWSMSL